MPVPGAYGPRPQTWKEKSTAWSHSKPALQANRSTLTSSDRRVLRPDVDQWRKDIEALYEAVKTGGEYYRKQRESGQTQQSQDGGIGGGVGDDGSMVLLASEQ